MKSTSPSGNLCGLLWIVGAVVWTCLCASTVSIAQPTEAKKTPAATAATAAARRFNTPQQAADALIDAAEKFDVAELAAPWQEFGNTDPEYTKSIVVTHAVLTCAPSFQRRRSG